MAGQIVDAVYENGVFRPLQPVGKDINEGEKVRLRLLTVGMALKSLEELTHIYDGLSEDEIKEIEKAILNRTGPKLDEDQSKTRKAT